MIFNMSTGGASTADKVKYNNTKSGLQSTDVQGAIDEVNSSLGVDIYTEKDSLFVNSEYIETCRMTKCGNVITVYIYFNNLPTDNTTIKISTKNGFFKPSINYPISALFSGENYLPKGTVWFYADSTISLYKPASLTEGHCYASYITND